MQPVSTRTVQALFSRYACKKALRSTRRVAIPHLRTLTSTTIRPAKRSANDSDAQASSYLFDVIFGEQDADTYLGEEAEEEDRDRDHAEGSVQQSFGSASLPERMQVRLKGGGTREISLPVDDFKPDYGANTGFYKMTEMTFNRMEHPDGKIVKFDWQRKIEGIANKNRDDALSPEDASYAGLAIPAPKGAGCPWKLERPEQRRLTAMGVLNKEIELFRAKSKLKPEEKRSRKMIGNALIRLAEELLSRSFSNAQEYKVELFGSTELGLALPFSDIDIRLRSIEATAQNTQLSEDAQEDVRQKLRSLYEALASVPQFDNVTIQETRLPLVEGSHCETGLRFQIMAGKSSGPQDLFTRRTVDCNKHSRTLQAILRTALYARSLTDTHNGGINSYVLTVMIGIWYGRGHIPDTAGEQLLSFLSFWGNVNTMKVGMSMKGPFRRHMYGPYLKRHARAAFRRGDITRAGQWLISGRPPLMKWLLCLQSPTKPNLDLGRKLYTIKHVLRTFEYLHTKLESGLSILDKVGSIDASLLESVVGDRRAVLTSDREAVYQLGKAIREAQLSAQPSI